MLGYGHECRAPGAAYRWGEGCPTVTADQVAAPGDHPPAAGPAAASPVGSERRDCGQVVRLIMIRGNQAVAWVSRVTASRPMDTRYPCHARSMGEGHDMTASLQFCAAGQDITGDFYAAEDATEVRAWEPDGTCLGAVQLGADGWQASASDVCTWTDCQEVYEGWRAALAALLAVSNSHRKIPEADWR